MPRFQAVYVSGDKLDRKQWSAFLEACPQAPVYVQPWYLDAVTDKSWSLALVYQGEQLVAGLPLLLKHKYLWQYSYQPPFTQVTGPVVHPELLRQKLPYVKLDQLFEALVEALPNTLADHQFAAPHDLSYLRAFYAAGYTLNTRYSFVISPEDTGGQKLDQYIHRDPRQNLKALSGAELRPATLEDFRQLLPKAGHYFQRDIYSTTATRLIAAGQKHSAVYMQQVLISDETAAIQVLFRDSVAYRNVLTITNEHHRKASPSTLLFFQHIQHALSEGLLFDFEGSMMPSVARYFSRFGGTPVPYINLRRRCPTKLTLPNRSF